MQTQCPHCETRFHVTESQLKAADGFVRCSVCEQVFNAFDAAEQDEHQQSLPIQQPTLNDEFAEVESTEDKHIEDTVVEQSADDPATAIEFDLSETENSDTELTHEDADAYSKDSEPSEINNEVEACDNKAPDDNTTHAYKSNSFNIPSTTDDSHKDAYDFFDEDENEPLSHVVPEQFKQNDNTNSAGLLSNMLWGVGTLLLVATLAMEYIWFNRDQLNQMPQLQIWAEKLCQRFECKNISMRNPKKVELVSRNVYSHPNEKNALMVNITMKNLANFAQPYPIMQIKFSDVRGGNVAARRFLPNEYLPAEMRQSALTQTQLFEADTNMTFTMEIQDPGKQAMTYEFDFL